MIEPRTEAMGLRCERNMLRTALGEIVERAWSPTAKGIARKALEEGRQLRLDVNRREKLPPSTYWYIDERTGMTATRADPEDIIGPEELRHRQSRP